MRRFLLFGTGCSLLLMAVFGFPFAAYTNEDGAQAAKTGAPGNGTCAESGCHDQYELNSGSGSVTIEAPATYTPGETVEFTVRVSQQGAQRFGFQATAKKETFQNTGRMLDDSDEVELSDAIGDYVTHSDAPVVDNEKTWTVHWQAPDEDAGVITIYAAGVAGNANGTNQGDYVYTATATMTSPSTTSVDAPEEPHTFTLQRAYPNPAVNETTVPYELKETARVTLRLVDGLGRVVERVDRGFQPPGAYEYRFEAGHLPSGLYLYELVTDTGRETRPLLLVR